MHGIKVKEDLTIYHRLFADDIGMFIPAMEMAFKEARAAIGLYKVALGANLNLKTLVVIPLGVANVPLWLKILGCHQPFGST